MIEVGTTARLVGRTTSGAGAAELVSVNNGLELSGSTIGIASAGVTLARMANLADGTVIGRASGAGTGVPVALTAADLQTILGTTHDTWTPALAGTGGSSPTYTRQVGYRRIETCGSWRRVWLSFDIAVTGAIGLTGPLTVTGGGYTPSATFEGLLGIAPDSGTGVTGVNCRMTSSAQTVALRKQTSTGWTNLDAADVGSDVVIIGQITFATAL